LRKVLKPGNCSLSESVYGLILNSGGGHINLVGVKLHELGEIELGLLENLKLLDDDILKGEDLDGFLGDLLGNRVGKELLEEVTEGGLGNFTEHDFHHLGAELLLLGALGVASSLDLLGMTAGESDSENTDEVAIEGLGLNEGLDEGVPLLDESAETVTSDVEAVEVGVAIVTLDFLALEANLAPCLFVSVGVEVTNGDGEDTVAEGIGGLLLTGGLVARGEAGDADIENAGNMNVVPFFLDESMHTKHSPPGIS
jgi:hypothetical protein